MSTFDRSKFKPTVLATQAAADATANAVLGVNSYEKADILEVKEGENMFRIYPPHPGDGQIYAEPFAKVFLPAIVPERDSAGNEVKDAAGKVKVKKSMKPVFNSRLHGGTEKDLVDEYVKLGKEKAESILDPLAKADYLAKLVGRYDPNPAKRLPGVSYQQSWAMYADSMDPVTGKILKFGRLEVKKFVKDSMNRLAAIENASQPLGTDPYTDPDNGRALCITYTPTEQNATKKYFCYLDAATTMMMIGGRQQKVVRDFPLSDEQLAHFLTFPSLHKLYHNSFKRSDFELQLNGLEMFDRDWNLGICAMPEWGKIVMEIDGYYPDAADNDDGPMTADQPIQRPANSPNVVSDIEPEEGDVEDEEEDNEVAADEFTNMTRDQLKAYNKQHQLGVVVRTGMSDDAVRNLIRERKEATTIPYIALPGEENLPQQQEVINVSNGNAVTTVTETTAERLQRLKAASNKG